MHYNVGHGKENGGGGVRERGKEDEKDGSTRKIRMYWLVYNTEWRLESLVQYKERYIGKSFTLHGKYRKVSYGTR